MNSSDPQPRVPSAAKIALGLVVGAYTDLLNREERAAFAASLMRSIDAATAEMEAMEPASRLAIETAAAIAVVQGLSEELKGPLTEP